MPKIVVCAHCGKLIHDVASTCWNCGAPREAAPAELNEGSSQSPQRHEPALAGVLGCLAGSGLAFLIVLVGVMFYPSAIAQSAWISVLIFSIVGLVIILFIPLLLPIPRATSAFARGLAAGAVLLFALAVVGYSIVLGILAVCNGLFKNV